MAERITVVVPDLGDFSDVEVIEVLAKAGDTIAVEAPLVTLETDKATMDVPSTAAGRIAELSVKKGDRVSKGSAIAVVETSAAAAPARPVAAAQAAQPPPAAAAAPPAPATSADIEVHVPDLGDFRDVEIIEVLVKEGDTVALESPLITLETEKATMDVPSSAAGRIAKLHVAKGARVNAGDRVATLQGTAAAASAPRAAEPAGQAVPGATPAHDATVRMTATPPAAAAATLPDLRGAHASPSVRRFARELGVDLTKVTGSGFKGRISEDDVKGFVKKALAGPPRSEAVGGALPRVPDVDFAAFGAVEVKPLGRIQKISGARLQAAWVNIPHVTQHDEADVTELEKLRASLKDRAAKRGIKLTPLAFIARACARVIAQFPNFNASLDASGPNLVIKKYLHLGFAADTPNGLVVP
ncbi:MAG TPA: biotin/lipoyl-containing protein, partial [Steroidobacteraceae bacterium]|nr:biotin/lipoyl-containing protein [Steroidobacteraceae bacterium]